MNLLTALMATPAVIMPSDWSIGSVGWLAALVLASVTVMVILLLLDNAATIAVRSALRSWDRRRDFVIGAVAAASAGALLGLLAGATLGTLLAIAALAGLAGGIAWTVRRGAR